MTNQEIELQWQLINKFTDTSTPAHAIGAGIGLITTALIKEKTRYLFPCFLVASGISYFVASRLLKEEFTINLPFS